MSFATRPRRGLEGAASEEFSSLSKTYLIQALEWLCTEKDLETVVVSPTCVPELRNWKAACFDIDGHREWILKRFSKTTRTMFAEDWLKFIEFLRCQQGRDDNLTPIAETVQERRWVHQWMSSATKLTESNVAGIFKNHMKQPEWCYETCLRLLVTVCDNLHRHPADGYFARLLESPSTPTKVMTPRSTKRPFDGPLSTHQKRPRVFDTRVENEVKLAPRADSIDIMPDLWKQSSVSKRPPRLSTPSSSSLGKDTQSPRSMTPSAGLFKKALPSRRKSNILFQDFTDSEDDAECPPSINVAKVAAVAFKGLGTPTFSPDPSSWKGRYLMETEKSIELVREMKKIVQERESATQAKERAVKKCHELARETEQLRHDLHDAVTEKDRAVEALTELQSKVSAIDEIIGRTSQL